MAAAAEVQNLLRFLTKDARIPLAEAMPKINSLRKLNLGSPEKIAQAPHADLKTIFTDEKILKTTVNAAKRVSNPKKKPSTPNRKNTSHDQRDSASDERDLELPETNLSEQDLTEVIIETNRAPLFLAFTLAVLNYIHPEQPISSKLSLAQTVVSTGAQSRAKYLGITSGPTAEEDGWAQGQPRIRLMGRDIAVMRRQHTQPTEDSLAMEEPAPAVTTSHDALWGIDLEALRKSNGPLTAGKNIARVGPPTHAPQSARNYLVKSMDIVTEQESATEHQSPKKKKLTATDMAIRKESAAAMVLKAIDIVLKSWQETLDKDDLDRRAQAWYALVRPEVAQGQAGWGQRGQVPLREILKLKRTTP